MIAYRAEIVATGPKGDRIIPATEFFTGPFETGLAHGELLTEIRIPAPGKNSGGAYVKLERKVGDFATAAKAALKVSGSDFLDARSSANTGEKVVRFRFRHRRFECVVHAETLRVIDSGICLTAHYDDDEFDPGVKGDAWLTLESLPGVIGQAIDQGKLVVYRHA